MDLKTYFERHPEVSQAAFGRKLSPPVEFPPEEAEPAENAA
jgi:hypothetical protein